MAIIPAVYKIGDYIKSFFRGTGMQMEGATSGSVAIKPPAVITDYEITLPDAAPASNGLTMVFQTDGTASFAAGATGLQGYQGRQGWQGAVGDTGSSGSAGAQGNQGWQGWQGAVGDTGSAGSAGAQGNQGRQGWQGSVGTTGVQGYQGWQGAVGDTGSSGSAGAQGYQGWQGWQGPIAPSGLQGYQGNQGWQGWQGAVGTGAQGNQGWQGGQGWQGLQGAQGWQGAVGTGAQGNQGWQGGQGWQGLTGPADVSINVVIDGGGSAITTGVKGTFEIPFAMTITGWTIAADQSGSIVVDVWKDSYANYPPTVADTIAGTEKPTLSSATKNQDLTLSTWTTAVSAGDIIAFNVDSATTVTRVTVSLRGTKP